jgi:pimeloyl-ACP methyl ester carboxylesterase
MERLPVAGSPRLYVEAWGRGPAVVLCHGFGGSGRNLRAQARGLEARARVVLFDARGHARSEAPAEPEAYERARLVEDFARVLDAAGAERAVVGGLSMGAGLALDFALAHPERVRGVALAAPPRSGPEHVRWCEELAGAIEARGIEAAGDGLVWGAGSRFDRAAAQRVRAGFLEHSPAALARLLRHTLALQRGPDELGPALARTGLPLLVVVGSEDAGSLAPARALSTAVPGAELVEVPGAGHLVNLQAPRALDRALERFLDGLAAASLAGKLA